MYILFLVINGCSNLQTKNAINNQNNHKENRIESRVYHQVNAVKSH